MSEDTSKPVPPLSDLAKDYLKEEQKQRRQEIENMSARRESDQRDGLIITGAIWSWLATHTDKLDRNNFAVVIIILPTLIMSFFYYRLRIMDKNILSIAEYVRELEGTSKNIRLRRDDRRLRAARCRFNGHRPFIEAI